MFHRKELWNQIGFWGVVLLAITAEWWAELLCRLVFPM